MIILISVYFNANSQNHVKNVRAEHFNNEIRIYYDLKLDGKKGYADLKCRTKSRKYVVDLFYSDNYQSNFIRVDDATGKIGKYVRSGRNKKIIWNPATNDFGLIGRISFKVNASPIIPKWSWGIAYCEGVINLGDLDNSTANIYHLFLYHSTGGNGSIFFPFSYIKAYGEYNYEYNSYYNSSYYYSCRLSTYEAITLGIGFQSNKRIFALHAGIGPMHEEFSKNEIEKSESGSVIFQNSIGNNYLLVLNGGVNIKIFDFKAFTILLPIGIIIEPADGDFLFLNAGVSLQF